MHIGLGLTSSQNLDGKATDLEVYREELALAARAEDAGFDSVWFSEHHFSDYQLTVADADVPVLAGGADEAGQAGHDGDRPARGTTRCGWPRAYSVLDHLSGGRAIAGHRPGPRADRVRQLPGGHGRVAPTVLRVQRGHPGGAGDGLYRVRR